MAIKAKDVTYAPMAFAAIEVKGVVYVVNADLAKSVQKALSEQLVFTSAEVPIRETLLASSEFAFDIANNNVLKPQV